MSDPQTIEIDVPTPLTSETGAIALLVKDIQHREDYSDSTVYLDTDLDVPSHPSTPTSDPLRKTYPPSTLKESLPPQTQTLTFSSAVSQKNSLKPYEID
jgi:hypothetical protein